MRPGFDGLVAVDDMNLYIIGTCVLLCVSFHIEALIQQVDDTDLIHLLTNEESVVVLFTKNNCNECDELEIILENIQNDLENEIKALVVKAHNSHMVGLYNPSKEPALVYFRRGAPLLYYGAYNAEEILQVFGENRDPIVRELSDLNFEHLTQASSGATTGDWFLFFYSADCVQCLRLQATWEAVGARLKHRVNVARIDGQEDGKATARRFGVVKSPQFLFLRQGKIYRYRKEQYLPGNLISFAEKDFLDQKHPESVPHDSHTINDLINTYIKFLNNPSLLWMSSFGIILTIILGCVLKYVFKRKTKNHGSKKSK